MWGGDPVRESNLFPSLVVGLPSAVGAVDAKHETLCFPFSDRIALNYFWEYLCPSLVCNVTEAPLPAVICASWKTSREMVMTMTELPFLLFSKGKSSPDYRIPTIGLKLSKLLTLRPIVQTLELNHT